MRFWNRKWQNEKLKTPTFGGFRVFQKKSEKKCQIGGRWRYKRENRFQQKSGKSFFRFFTQNAFSLFEVQFRLCDRVGRKCEVRKVRNRKLNTRFGSEVSAWPRVCFWFLRKWVRSKRKVEVEILEASDARSSAWRSCLSVYKNKVEQEKYKGRCLVQGDFQVFTKMG